MNDNGFEVSSIVTDWYFIKDSDDKSCNVWSELSLRILL